MKWTIYSEFLVVMIRMSFTRNESEDQSEVATSARNLRKRCPLRRAGRSNLKARFKVT